MNHNHHEQLKNNNQSFGHTLSYHTEMDKVRVESQKKFNEMQAFYEKELVKMRQEFENREIRIKEKIEY